MESVQEIGTREVLACDESFFTALLAADHELLGTILANDFLIIDVLSGQAGRLRRHPPDVGAPLTQPVIKGWQAAHRCS